MTPNNNQHPSLHQLFRINDYVIVDNLHYGYIAGAIDPLFNTCSIKFAVGGQLLHAISLLRVRVVFLGHNTQLRNNKTRQININEINTTTNNNKNKDSKRINTNSGSINLEIEESLPSINLINPNFIQPSFATTTTTTTPTTTTPSTTTLKPLNTLYNEFKDAYIQSIGYQASSTNPPPHPLHEFFKQNNEREKGWMRKVIQQNNEIDVAKHLLTKEREVLTSLTIMISSSSFYGFNAMLVKSFNTNRNTSKIITKSYIKNNFEFIRKERCDKDDTVFSSEKRRKLVFTAYNTYKKHMSCRFRSDTTILNNEDLKNGFRQLNENNKRSYEILAERNLDRAVHLWDDICQLLKRANGKIAFSTITSHVNNIVSTNTIFRYLRSQPSFSMRRDRILPSLDRAARVRRFRWASTYMKFWKYVKTCPPSRVRFVQVHMDEKWFYGVRSRSNTKVLTSIGLHPTDSYVHHKNHIDKYMYVVTTACVLNNNDFQKGGKAVPISCIRVGKYEEAKKNTYRRVYKSNGEFHYPKIQSNLLREKGKKYFKSLDLRGSTSGTARFPKVSLLNLYEEEIIPAIEKKIVKEYGENGNVKIVIVKQEDGAGLHNDREYLRKMNRLFKRRGWLLFNQPPQSPMTNVHGSCIFPMMSKQVTNTQSVVFNKRLVQGEELHRIVKQVWDNKSNIFAMSKAFAGHHQLVAAIIQNKGYNTYLSQQGGLSFGIRRTYIADESGEGVVPVDEAPVDASETGMGIFSALSSVYGLKFCIPHMKDLTEGKLTDEMKRILKMHVDTRRFDDELRDAWKAEEFSKIES